VVNEVVEGLGLENVKTTHTRVEDIKETYDFVISRAVAAMPTFVHWIKGKVSKQHNNSLKNGIIYLKGGDLAEELQDYKTATIYNISDYYTEDFYDTKKIVHLPVKYKV
jgi:16S rRNA (guanine527-N7)-methyltransferase